jgi:hypothetical protein
MMKIFRQPGGHEKRLGVGDVSATQSLGQAVTENFFLIYFFQHGWEWSSVTIG